VIPQAVPEQLIEALDISLSALVDDSDLEAEPADPETREAERLAQMGSSSVSLNELASDVAPAEKRVVGLARPDPIRFTLGDLRELWQEAVANLRRPGGSKTPHRHIPIGPYRLTVVASVRGRAAGQVAIQGMLNKQIELLVPSFRTGSGSRHVLAIWIYQDHSLVITYLDFKKAERYILWHAPTGQQANFGGSADLNHNLYQLGLEAPDQVDRALSRWFRPRNAV
jgi:serine/threonine-protein kinase